MRDVRSPRSRFCSYSGEMSRQNEEEKENVGDLIENIEEFFLLSKADMRWRLRQQRERMKNLVREYARLREENSRLRSGVPDESPSRLAHDPWAVPEAQETRVAHEPVPTPQRRTARFACRNPRIASTPRTIPNATIAYPANSAIVATVHQP